MRDGTGGGGTGGRVVVREGVKHCTETPAHYSTRVYV